MRMPSFSKSFKDWAEYLRESDMTIDEAIEKTTSDAVASWLEENRDRIEDIMDAEGTAIATFVTQGTIVDSPEDELEDEPETHYDTDDSVPVKGIKI